MQNGPLKLHLAPMEGVVDWVLRDTLTSVGGIDHCVTEFLRVTNTLYPDSVFYKNCPELKTDSRTRSGVPVFVQLLGGQAQSLAENAAKAVELGACGIDLNFGCPAKTVNRHDGGASLLKSPDRINEIVSKVRSSVPSHIPVTAKMRLGFDDPAKCFENAAAIEAGGAQWLTLHCRTKIDGYKPPAYWEWIPKIRELTKIPIVANGEIWTIEDFNRCQGVTNCNEFMIGRGALRDPFIFQKIKNYKTAAYLKSAVSDLNSHLSLQSDHNKTVPLHSDWERIKEMIPKFYEASTLFINERFAVARTKQWLKQLASAHPEAQEFFDKIKLNHDSISFDSI